MTEVLPSGWARAPIGSLISGGGLFFDGDWVESKDQDPNGEVRLIQLADVGVGEFRNRSSRFLTSTKAAELNCTYLEPQDVLVARMPDPLGRACAFPRGFGSCVTVVDVAVLRPSPESVDPAWLMWAINSPQCSSQVAALQSGTTRKRISRRNLATIQLTVPPLEEQRRIVTAIDEHFSRLNAVETSLTAAEMRCQALTKSIIVRSIPNKLPEDWRLKTVAEAGETGLGRQRSPKYHSGPNMKPYLRVANVFEDRINTSSIMEMHFEGAEFDKYRLRYGDVLLNEGQSPELLGRPAIYVGEPPDTAFTNSLIRFVPGPGVMSEWALLVFRRHMHARRFMRESRITTNIAHLALGRFRTVEFPIPPLKTQQELVASTRASLSSIDQLIDQIRSARARTEAMRRAVLAAAFSGQLVPQDPSDEHASLLLERIAASRSTKPNRRASARQVS